ncbi:MAG: ATP-dependent helicase, partial [Clostridia bacterium]|nr:ATP-dependent helicase [Clostridia bacterium]
MFAKDIHSDLNSEKIEILSKQGSVLVVANPGTGKTFLLAHKFLDLVKNGVPVEDILCLTFTRKAKKEMEDRILKSLKDNGFESGKLNVFTFHSYALDGIEEDDIVSSDLLRFNIYEYLLENEVFIYPDEYLLENIVPKLENAIRYIKNYGVLPGLINSNKVKSLIEDLKKGKKITYTKEQLEVYFDHFLNIFKNYEESKTGSDYTDILINFLKIKMDKFKWVLVDELQDVNNLEAQIALKSGENFFTVGDKKQAIFGFQGGSISNFELFKELGTEEKLVDNFRSTNEILDYAKAYYLSKNQTALDELKDLKSAKDLSGKKPVVIEYDKDDDGKIVVLAKELVKDLKEDEQVGVIVRTNGQILKYSKLFNNAGVDFSATFSSSSEEARENIIRFIKAIFSSDIEVIKNSFFTPFFPCEMQKSFELSSNKKLTLEELKVVCPKFFELKEKTKNIEDVNTLFKENILPV